MARSLSRFAPVLLPPLAGLVCFVWSAGLPRRPAPAGPGGEGPGPERVTGRESGLGAEDRDALGRLRRLEARVTAAADVPALAAVWTELGEGVGVEWIRNRLGKRIYSRMLDLDPEAAWAWVRSFPDEYPPPAVDFLQVWGARDPATAAAAAMGLPGQPTVSLYQVAMGWAAADPEGYLKAGTPDAWKMMRGQQVMFERAALMALAETDLTRALALAPKHGMDDSHAARDVFKKLADRMMEERGVEGALAWARGLQDYTDTPRRRLLAEILPALARTDPRRAARELSGEMSQQTPEAAALIAGQWAAKEPGEALKWATELPLNGVGGNPNTEPALTKIGEVIGPDAGGLLRAAGEMTLQPGLPERAAVYKLFPLIAGAAGMDPAKLTADLAEAGPSGGRQSALVAASLLQWSMRDAPAAFAYLRTLPEEMAPLAREVMAGNGNHSGLAGITAGRAAEFLQTLRDDPALTERNGPSIRSEVWRRLADQDPQAALTLLGKYSDGGVSGGNNVSDGDGAGGDSAGGSGGGGGGGGKGVDERSWSAVYSAWAARDPQAAADRILTVPEERRAAAVDGLVAGWAEFDPMAASVWAGALPAGPGREAAAASLARALVEVEPASAFAWAVSMNEGDRRAEMLESALRAWGREDAGEARRALDNPSLSAATREHFSKILDRLPK